jgi:hypothetical protein
VGLVVGQGGEGGWGGRGIEDFHGWDFVLFLIIIFCFSFCIAFRGGMGFFFGVYEFALVR